MKHRTPNPFHSEDQQTVTIGTDSEAALWSDVAMDERQVGPVGAGWRTLVEVATEEQMSRSAIRERFAALVAAGKLERERARTETGGFAVYYRPIAKRRCAA